MLVRFLRFSPLLTISLVACARVPEPHAAVDAQIEAHGRRLHAARADYEHQRWASVCPEGQTRRCGLVVEQVSRASFQRRFVRDICHEAGGSVDASSSSCQQHFRSLVAARWSERYDEVSPAEIEAHCTADPWACERAADIERWLAEEHNARAGAQYEAELRVLERERAEALGAAQARDADAQRAYQREVARSFHRAHAFADLLTGREVCLTRTLADELSATSCYRLE